MMYADMCAKWSCHSETGAQSLSANEQLDRDFNKMPRWSRLKWAGTDSPRVNGLLAELAFNTILIALTKIDCDVCQPALHLRVC